MLRRALRTGLVGAALLLSVIAPLAGWWVGSESVDVWPVRNTLQYALAARWWDLTGRASQASRTATGADPAVWTTYGGRVLDLSGAPVPDVRVLLTAWDGTALAVRTASDGTFRIERVPAGEYTAVAGHPELGAAHARVRLAGGAAQSAALRLEARPAATSEAALRQLAAAVRADDRQLVASSMPVPGRAVRWEVHFADRVHGGRGRTLLYLPEHASEGTAAATKWPLLLTAYPGPAEQWESASVPLAAAGFAVVAYAPPYSFTPEASVEELRALLAAGGALPGVDGSRAAILAGSYSGLHALRVLQDEHSNGALRAAVLMGAPADLFDMRRRLEDRSFVPPFGLDQALVALGFPDREVRRYWRYSGAYHVRRGMPPALLVHSRQDDVVPYQQSELLAGALREAGVPHELHLLDGGSHYLLSADEDARRIYELTVRFLGERL